MNSFGQELYVLNKDNFECMFKQTYMLKLRKKLYLFMISNRNENDFFDIEKFNRKYIRDMNKTNDMINIIIKELKMDEINIVFDDEQEVEFNVDQLCCDEITETEAQIRKVNLDTFAF